MSVPSKMIEFPDEGISVEDEDALVDADEADLLFGEGSGDLPAASVEGELSGLFQAVDFGLLGILPWWRIGVVGLGTGLP